MPLAFVPVLGEPAEYLASSGLPESSTGYQGSEIWRGLDRDILIPILESSDLSATFQEKREAYDRWRDSLVKVGEYGEMVAGGLPEDLTCFLSQEDELLDMWRSIIEEARGRLDPASVRALLGSLDLRRIVSHSTWPHLSEWPERSWAYIDQRMTSNELCTLCLIFHLATRVGARPNVRKPGCMGFQVR